jgi:hypothetical protein
MLGGPREKRDKQKEIIKSTKTNKQTNPMAFSPQANYTD